MAKVKTNFEGEQVSIRKLRLGDAWEVYINIRDEEVSKWTVMPPRYYSENTAIRFVQKILRPLHRIAQFTWGRLRKKESKFSIVLRETGKVIGLVSMMKIDQYNSCSELGFWIGKEYWGRGLATEVVKLALKFGFKELGLHRIYSKTSERNTGSKRVLEKCGFKLEGVSREAYCKDSQRHNILNYGILKSEYKNSQASR